jgi:uncharacterized protein (DUF58 family)
VRVTHQFWSVAAGGGFLLLWGVIVGDPVYLVGAGAIGAWISIAQYRFLRDASDELAGLTVDVTLDDEDPVAEGTSQIRLVVESETTVEIPLRVAVELPAGVGGTAPTAALRNQSSTGARDTAEVYWPVAGEFAFEQPTVTVQDRFGLFTQTVERGTVPTVTVKPRAPRQIHVGRGGERVVLGFGEHETGQTGSGLKPTEVRKYVPGDTIRQIDWKATARLVEPHVREFEVESDRETRLVIDHRGCMSDGPPGRTKIDFIKQVALAVSDISYRSDDPLSCLTVGDDGTTSQYDPTTAADGLGSIRREILALTPTAAESGTGLDAPAVARRRAVALDSDSSAFGRTLRPYFAARDQYVQRVKARPLFQSLRAVESRRRRGAWVVILTDDTHAVELREAVKLARRDGTHVSVYLTPSVLFEDGALAEVESAYERYVEFETLRHELDSMEGVSAFEVGPEDRLSSILGRQTRRERGGQV